jgi:hypothetical protein
MKQSDQQRPDDAAASREQQEQVSGTVAKDAPGAVPLGQRGQIYTMTAQEGLNVSELVNAAFGRKTIGARTPRRVELVAPDGPSTAGGKRARQTIRLVPASGDGAPVMCGYLDAARKIVELRSYGSVAEQYAERFSASFDVTEAEYAALCRDLEATLGAFRYSFVHEVASPSSAAAAKRAKHITADPKPSAPLLNMVLIGMVVTIVAVLALVMVLK